MTTSINFWIILGPSQKEIGGGGWYWTLFMAAILLAGILTLSTQLATFLSILKEIYTTLYKDFCLTRWSRGLVIRHHYRHSDDLVFTMFFLNLKKNMKQKLLWWLTCLHRRTPPFPPRSRQHTVQRPNSKSLTGGDKVDFGMGWWGGTFWLSALRKLRFGLRILLHILQYLLTKFHWNEI